MMITKLVNSIKQKYPISYRKPKQAIIEYYTETHHENYGWSKNYNMHFGYFEFGMNPFDLESQLQMMNKLVLNRLQLSHFKNNQVLDLGCGLGATMRYAVGRYPIKSLTGITIVKKQVEKAIELMAKNLYGYCTKFKIGDFEEMAFNNDSFDGIYAIESICHAPSMNKERVLKEAYRVLKPGKRLVITDGFIKPCSPENTFFQFCYRKMCNSWTVNEYASIDQFYNTMKEIGFKKIEVKEISWNAACSALHIPFIGLKYLVARILLSRHIMNKQRWNHFLAPILSLIVALHRKQFGYYIITAKK